MSTAAFGGESAWPTGTVAAAVGPELRAWVADTETGPDSATDDGISLPDAITDRVTNWWKDLSGRSQGLPNEDGITAPGK